MKVNLKNGMTTDQAVRRFECSTCRTGDRCGWDCVESATCSLRCVKCNTRNWFQGSLPSTTPWVFVCVACDEVNVFKD
jgi:hypothetical protein